MVTLIDLQMRRAGLSASAELPVSEWIALSGALHLLIFVARWRHNFREIAVKNCGQKLRKVQRLAEKFVRTTSYR